jgi:hypothetical protein
VTVEHIFTMIEHDDLGQIVSFDVIEDEDGERFWGHGHVDPEEFIAEVNKWLVHVGAITSPDDFLYASTHKVEHLWAKMTTEERFELTKDLHEEDDDGVFPVTRLML